MSAPPSKFWPSVGSKWQHWSDLLLATQLAALCAGFNYIGRYWHPQVPERLRFVCAVELVKNRKKRCKHPLVVAKPTIASDPSRGWEVVELHADFLEASRHPDHVGGIGISQWQKHSSILPSVLRIGDTITGFREMHDLEGSLKSLARRQGRFLTSRLAGGAGLDILINCVLDTSCCNFLVRFRPIDVPDGGEPRWRCVEIRGSHTGVTTAKAPQERLVWRMNFFPDVQLVNGSIGVPTKVHKPNLKENYMSETDQRIGPFPVRIRTNNDHESAVLELSNSSNANPGAPALTAKDSTASSRRIDTLRTDFAVAQTELDSASAAADKLKASLAAAEKLVEVQRKRVEKREKRLKRAVEKAERKKTKVKEGRRKKDKGKGKNNTERAKGKAGRA